jgi:hypothetical protein
MNFKEYINTRRVTDNPRGDFIKDTQDVYALQDNYNVSAERKMPDNFKTWVDLKVYLQRRGACPEAIKAG